MGATLLVLKGHSYSVCAIAFSPDGKQLASSSEDTTVWVWDAVTGATLVILEGHQNLINNLAFSPDGKPLASCGHCDAVRVWDLETGVALHSFNRGRDSATAVVFSPNGKLLACGGSYCNLLQVADVTTGATLQVFDSAPGGSMFPEAIAFSPDGKHLASNLGYQAVCIWDVATGEFLHILHTHEDVEFLSYSSDGSIVTDCRRLYRIAALDTAVSSSITLSIRPLSPSTLQPWISVQGEWIVSDNERVLWLHPDYRPHRPYCRAVYGGMVCLGHASDRVSLFEFSFGD